MNMEHNMTEHSVSGHHNHGSAIGNEGLLLSHSVLGTFVFGLGLWWWIRAIRQCYSAARHPNKNYEASVSYGSGCCPNLVGEGVVKLVVCLIGMATEAGSIHLGRHPAYAHYPFYSAMLLAAMVDILQSTVLFLPDGVDYMCHILPFIFQAYYMRAQAYDQPHVTASCRHVSSYLGVLAAAGLASEMVIRNRFISSWIKCFTVMLSGAWTWQMAIMLDPNVGQAWNEESHDNVMYTVIVTSWQMFGVAVFQLITLLISAKIFGLSSDWTAVRNEAAKRSTCSTGFGREDIQYTKLLTEEPLEE